MNKLVQLVRCLITSSFVSCKTMELFLRVDAWTALFDHESDVIEVVGMLILIGLGDLYRLTELIVLLILTEKII